MLSLGTRPEGGLEAAKKNLSCSDNCLTFAPAPPQLILKGCCVEFGQSWNKSGIKHKWHMIYLLFSLKEAELFEPSALKSVESKAYERS